MGAVVHMAFDNLHHLLVSENLSNLRSWSACEGDFDIVAKQDGELILE